MLSVTTVLLLLLLAACYTNIEYPIRLPLAHGVIWGFSPTGDTTTVDSRVQLARGRAATLLQLLSLPLCTRRSLTRHPPPRDTYMVLGLTGESGITLTANEK